MAKIIKFPTGEEIDPKDLGIEKSEHDIISERSDECIKASQELFNILEEFICTGQVSEYPELMNMNFRDEACHESRDIFVVVNMINAMLNRYMGIPHQLHRDLDKMYILLKLMNKGEHDDR
tara:strand:- start:865 stop:1227 length:363 start_codon:yes stop_codon:yes gene_type:complete